MNLKNFPILVGSIPQLFDPELSNEFKNFPNLWEVHSTTFDPQLRNELKNFSNPEGTIPQLLTLNSEMKVLHWYLLWGFLQY